MSQRLFHREEYRVDLTKWYGEAGGGTADYIEVRDQTLRVFDLKYGRGERVEAKNNGQLKLYALGALQLCWLLGLEIEFVEWHICQPRLNHWDSDSCTANELLNFGEYVKRAAALTRLPGAELTAGPEQCRWCRAKSFCPELAKYSQVVVAQAVVAADFPAWSAPVSPLPPESLTDQQIVNILPQADMIEEWLKAVRGEAFRRTAAAGGVWCGWELVQGRAGARKWKPDSAPALIQKAQELGHPRSVLYSEPALLSPAQVEKAVGKKQFAELTYLTDQLPGAPGLAPESDKRPALPPAVLPTDFPLYEGTES